MRIIFLDIDGVLNYESYVSSCNYYGIIIDASRMELLKQIVDATDAKIVLSSSWREHWEKEADTCDNMGIEIDRIFQKHKLSIFDKTDSFSRHREEEIKSWLDSHTDIENFVVLDDRFLSADYIKDHFVKT